MKKIILILLALLLLIPLSGCSTEPKPEPEPKTFSKKEMNKMIAGYEDRLKAIIKKYDLKKGSPQSENIIELTDSETKSKTAYNYQNKKGKLRVEFIFVKNNEKYINPEILVSYNIYANTEQQSIKNLRNESDFKLFTEVANSLSFEKELAYQAFDESYSLINNYRSNRIPKVNNDSLDGYSVSTNRDIESEMKAEAQFGYDGDLKKYFSGYTAKSAVDLNKKGE